MKTILISSYHGSISRNILQTQILPILNDNNIRVVVVCHSGQQKYIQRLVGDKASVIVASYETRHIDNVIQLISMGLVTNYNLFMRKIWSEGRYFRVIFMQMLYLLGSKIYLFKKTLRWIFKNSSFEPQFDDIFDTYKPDIVFVTDIFSFSDSKLIIEASKRGIDTIGMVRSWDNPTTRGILLAMPEKIICWNEIVKDELIKINRFPEKDILISGVPHHDRIFNLPKTKRDEFLENMGLDPNKKTLMLAPGGSMQYKYDGEILKLFKRLKDSNSFTYPVQFLVRQQPADTMCLNGFEPDKEPDFIIDEPGVNLSGRKKESEIRKSDDDSLVNSLRFSDVIMTVISSVTLDAIYYDRPTIIITLDPRKGLDDSPKKFFRYKHMQKLFSWGLLTIANTEEEFIKQVNDYLNNPDLNHDKRVKLAEKYAYKLDGESSQRVAGFLISSLNER